jgi:tRNA(Ile)-lysidine synthase
MTQLVEKVCAFIRAHNLYLPGQRVLVAWSGGSDSTALVEILREISQQINIKILVAHIDHGQTPGSHQVLRRLRARANRLGVQFFGVTPGSAVLPPRSSEERCRQERYRILQSLAQENDCDRIATGHTQDDQVETLLMRMVRGTRIDGLIGIPIQREDIFIRPVLCCSREELRAFLHSRRIRWVEDPSNQSLRFLRNQIRHHLLPTLRTMNPEVDQALLRLSEAARQDCQVLNRMAAQIKLQRESDAGVSLPLSDAQHLPDAVLLRVLLRMARLLAGPGANLPGEHLERIVKRIRKSHDKHWSLDLPSGLDAGLEGGFVFLRFAPNENRKGFSIEVKGPGMITLPDQVQRLHFKVVRRFRREQAGPTRAFFDGDEINFPLEIRSVLPGDRLQLWGNAGSHKVNRILMDAKVPSRTRSLVPLLVKGNEVLWVAGIRRSSIAPVKPNAQKILKVELIQPAKTSAQDLHFYPIRAWK